MKAKLRLYLLTVATLLLMLIPSIAFGYLPTDGSASSDSIYTDNDYKFSLSIPAGSQTNITAEHPDNISSREASASGCTQTKGWWRSRPDSWPVDSMTLGNTTYTKEQLLDILYTYHNDDATYILAYQLIAAKLNIANGASPSAVASTIADADAWLTSHAIGSNPQGADRMPGIEYSEIFVDYNEGEIGPGHCDDNPGCTQTKGWWRTRPALWPVDSMVLGNVTYSDAELLDILYTYHNDDATYILAYQLIAAKLNIAGGADDSAVASTIVNADAWLTEHPIGSNPQGADRMPGIEYSVVLNSYNEGDIGPGSCDDSGTTPTPAPTTTTIPTTTPVPPTATATETAPVCTGTPLDLLYVLDLSGSMNGAYPNASNKLEAAKAAIYGVDSMLAEHSSDSNVALITFNGSTAELRSGFTNNFAEIDTIVQGLIADGTTPTARALQEALSLMQSADASHTPMVLLLTDGVPTLDLHGHFFQDPHVQAVSLYDGDGNFLPASTIRTSGQYYSDYNEYAGSPPADGMDEVLNFNAGTEANIYSVAIQGEIFNNDFLEYAAFSTGGQSYAANDANALVDAIQQAILDASCGTPTVTPTNTPITPTYTSTATNTPTDTPTAVSPTATSTLTPYPSPTTHTPTPTYTPTVSITPSPTDTPITPTPPTGVTIMVDPETTTVDDGDTFSVSVVVNAGDGEVDGASAYLNFDKDTVQVVSMTGGSSFQFELQNSFDNEAGTIDFAAGSFSNLPSGTFTLVEIEFSAIGATSGSDLAFQFTAPRQTDVTSSGVSVLDGHTDGTIIVSGDVPPTNTPQPPTATNTPTAIPSATNTPTAIPSATNTPTAIPSATSTPPAAEDVTIVVDPETTTVDDGDTFSVSVVVNAGDGEVDGASAYLNFDKDAVQVVSMTGGSSFQFELQNSFDNEAGTIDFAAGSFSNLPSGTFTLVEIEFSAIGATSGSDLAFQFTAPRQTDVTSSGVSVLDGHSDGTIIVSGDVPPTNTPQPPTATNTPEPPTATNTPQPPTATNTPQPPTPTNTPEPTGITIAVDPAAVSANVGDTVLVSIPVITGDEEIDGASAYLNFDKDVLQVVSMTGGSSFQFELQNSFDNEAGTIDFAAGSIGNLPSGNITLVDIEFSAIAPTAGSELAFQFSAPRQTDVTSAGASVLTGHSNGEVTISPVAPDSFNVTEQSDGNLLTWGTTSEEEMDGFNLYRTISPEWSRSFSTSMLNQLNDELITANGEPSSYSFLDDTAEEGTTYNYWLEYVMLDGSTQMHPDSVTNEPGEVTSITLGDINADGIPAKRDALPFLAIGLMMLAGAWIVRRRR